MSDNDNTNTPLILPGSEPPSGSIPTDTTVPERAVPASIVVPGRRVNFKRLWLIVTVSWVLTIALLLGLLFAVVPALMSSRSASRSPGQTQTVTPVSTPGSSATTVPRSAPLSGIAIVPNHFNVVTDCQVDNGYRCTATLITSQSLPGPIVWSTSSNGVATKFNPPGGTLPAGQQQQVIIYIYNPCPYDGTLVFSIARGSATVPVHC